MWMLVGNMFIQRISFMGLLCTLWYVAVLGFFSDALAHSRNSTAWESIQGNARWRLGPLAGRTPPGSPAAWRTVHQAQGFSSHTLAYTGQRLAQTHDAIQVLDDMGVLEWEIALLAASVEHQELRPELGHSWIHFLRNWSGFSEAQRVQIQLSLRLRLVGGALASLDSTCMPSDLHAADTLVDLAYIEQEVPGRRLRSRMEPPPQFPEEALEEALVGPDRLAVEGALSLVALTSPSALVLAQWAPQSSWDSADCIGRYVQGFTTLLSDPSVRGDVVFQQLIDQTDYPIETRWLWRFAVHRYLMGDGAAIDSISRYFDAHHSEEKAGAHLMHVLAAIATGGWNIPSRSWPDANEGSNPTYKWVAAEAARARGDVADAETALASIVESDVHFTAGWISLIVARIQLHRGYEAALAFETLRSLVPVLPIYTYWLSVLERRLVEQGSL